MTDRKEDANLLAWIAEGVFKDYSAMVWTWRHADAFYSQTQPEAAANYALALEFVGNEPDALSKALAMGDGATARRLIVEAFAASCEGYDADELIIDEDKPRVFIKRMNTPAGVPAVNICAAIRSASVLQMDQVARMVSIATANPDLVAFFDAVTTQLKEMPQKGNA